MKILIKRYPELQKHQISCHAAHEENSRMYPCGKCEKCRRIIGMVRVLDENPENCGYSKTQIDYGLRALESNAVKQIGSDVAQLYHMLLAGNHIKKNEFTQRLAKKHSEITKLRFDKERSNLEDMPKYIRKSLFNILSQYADGAVIRKNNRWVDFQLEDEFIFKTKYQGDEE